MDFAEKIDWSLLAWKGGSLNLVTLCEVLRSYLEKISQGHKGLGRTMEYIDGRKGWGPPPPSPFIRGAVALANFCLNYGLQISTIGIIW